MNLEKEVIKNFPKDVENHTMEVLQDNGVYRHLKFSRGGSSIMHFEVVTFPQYLVYVGDMGSFTFKRTEDMFRFFRSSKGEVNPFYWSKKIEAEDECDGYQKFSLEAFKDNVKSWFLDLEFDGDPEDVNPDSDPERWSQDRKECWVQIEDDVFYNLEDEDARQAYSSVMGFEYKGTSLFDDFWEVDSMEYTYRYLWCCHALVWAINQYDKYKGTEVDGKTVV